MTTTCIREQCTLSCCQSPTPDNRNIIPNDRNLFPKTYCNIKYKIARQTITQGTLNLNYIVIIQIYMQSGDCTQWTYAEAWKLSCLFPGTYQQNCSPTAIIPQSTCRNLPLLLWSTESVLDKTWTTPSY